MRVTLVSPFDPLPPLSEGGKAAHVGGVERVYAELARALARGGHDVTVLCSTQGPAEDVVQDGVRVLREPRRATVLRTPVARLARHIPRDSDMVQVAATYPLTTPGVIRHCHARRQPVVLDFHFEPVVPGAVGTLAAAAYRQLGPRAYPLADAVLVRSVAYARSAPSLRHVPEERWRVLPNGIDPARFHPDGPAHPDHPGPYLLFVGRLVPYKGLEVLLKALHRHKVGMPLLVVGDGPLRDTLRAQARKLGVDVRWLGNVPDEELPGLYRGAALTVLPSVNGQEAFGICLLENMACGTPVVASQLPGVADVARIGGYTARVGDAVGLSAQLRHALRSDFVPRGPKLAQLVHSQYSWDAIAAKAVAAYEEVLARRIPGGTTLAHPLRHPVLQP